MKFKLFQLRHEENTIRKYGFMDFNFAENHGFSIEDYEVTYEGEIEADRYIEGTLENIFRKFNIDRPEDFRGHSLSVSDIIQSGGHFYYIEVIGFKLIDSHIDYDLLQ